MGIQKGPLATDYLRGSARGTDGGQTWSCISRRPQSNRDGVLYEGAYRQAPAGAFGIALAGAVVIEFQHPGRYVREGMQIQNFSRVLHPLLAGAKIHAVLHNHCAIHSNAGSISNGIANQSQRNVILSRSQEFNPRITAERYDRIAEAFGRITASKLISEPSLSHKGLAVAHEPLRSAWLANEVEAVGFIANWWKDRLYDATWGGEQRLPMIHASLADLSYVNSALKPVSGGELHSLQDVISVFLGAISTQTLLDKDGNMLPIHLVGNPDDTV